MNAKQIGWGATTVAVILAGLAGCSHERVRSDYVGTASMNQDQIAALLMQQGYFAITDLHKNGDDWVGGATKDGQVVTFDIDARGKIHTK